MKPEPHAHETLRPTVSPLRAGLNAPFDDLAPLSDRVRSAKVVALGSTVRHSHELLTLTHRAMRFLIDQHGFRALALEGDEGASIDLDSYVRAAGKGDPRAILTGARPFWRFEEILEAIYWLRARNERYPGDQIHVVHRRESPQEAPRHAGAEDVERRLADSVIAWHERTGDRIVYWGGLAHTANGLATSRNAGSHLKARFGSDYVSIALTFHHGSLPAPVGVSPADSIEAVLGTADLETYLVDLHDQPSDPVREWLETPAKARLIGPGIHELHGPSLRTWVDFIIHSRSITPAHPL